MTDDKPRRQPSPRQPRMGTHGAHPATSGSIHGRRIECLHCDWTGFRANAEDPCTKCGDSVVIAIPYAQRRRQAKPTVLVGVRDPLEEAETNRRLAEAREAAQR